ncbi:MAG TPA: hypothetical protein VFI47_29575 [Acidimicrobiales bacterium]|nr:hypothetical protein [Acidimicrobiales bacterium]
MCMQCVAQGAPFVGAAVTVLNRRNLRNWATGTWQRVHGTARLLGPADGRPAAGTVPATGRAPADAVASPSAAGDRVGAGLSS